jgi:nucleoside-diphosphate-sugar epimerase
VAPLRLPDDHLRAASCLPKDAVSLAASAFADLSRGASGDLEGRDELALEPLPARFLLALDAFGCIFECRSLLVDALDAGAKVVHLSRKLLALTPHELVALAELLLVSPEARLSHGLELRYRKSARAASNAYFSSGTDQRVSRGPMLVKADVRAGSVAGVKLLVLGGTLFLGRHVVEEAVGRGHDVTLFNRGHTDPDLFPDLERLRGDREGDLSALAGRTWDAVFDPSGYVPRVVRATAEALASSVGHYTFVSSGSVYPFEHGSHDEESPVEELEEETEDVTRAYGALKALAEREVEQVFPGRALILRAGLIVGNYDWTNRFGYWIRRVAEGGEVLIPAPRNWAIQFVDARDVVGWALDMAEQGEAGTFNAAGPEEPITIEELVEAVKRVSGSDARFTWVDEDFLLDQGLEPFDDVPLWLALGRNPELSSFYAMSNAKALGAGLSFRPLDDTIADTLAWERERSGGPLKKDYGAGGEVPGLSSAREARVLRAWQERA